jgi:hypothetical protein
MKIPDFENHCLRPYRQDEAAEVHWIAKEHRRSERTIRNWCVQFGIGRQLTVGGPWSVSRVVLLTFLMATSGRWMLTYQANVSAIWSRNIITVPVWPTC